MLKFHSAVSPDPLNARLLRSLGFPKSPPLKILAPPMRDPFDGAAEKLYIIFPSLVGLVIIHIDNVIY